MRLILPHLVTHHHGIDHLRKRNEGRDQLVVARLDGLVVSQTRYDQLVPALIPLSQMVDSVVVRNEVREYQPHPSATTFLRDVYKVREGEKG